MQSLIQGLEQPSTYSPCPKVYLNAQTGVCVLSGRSFMITPYSFYKEILDWQEAFIKMPKRRIYWCLNLSFVSIGSKKMLLHLLKQLREYKDLGGEVAIEWIVAQRDEDLINEIREIALFSNVPIRLLHPEARSSKQTHTI